MDDVRRTAAGSEELRRRALAGASRPRILRALREEGPLDADELADRVGLHRNTVRAHLGVLERAGLIERETERAGRPGRPRVRYRAAPEPVPGYLLLSRILAGHLARSRARIAERMVAAGRAWGRAEVGTARGEAGGEGSWPEVTARMVELLADLGFDPEVRPRRWGAEVFLHACPFREVAEEHPEVVCSVHLGLLQGALEGLGARATADLRPFVEPALCVARLREARR